MSNFTFINITCIMKVLAKGQKRERKKKNTRSSDSCTTSLSSNLPFDIKKKKNRLFSLVMYNIHNYQVMSDNIKLFFTSKEYNQKSTRMFLQQ